MKKVISVLCMLMLITMTSALAAKNGFKIQYDGKTVDYTAEPMTVSVNFKQIEMPLAPIVFNDRALVPVREVFEAMDAEVTYNHEKKQVTLETEEAKVLIAINSNTAYVNGKKTAIPDGLVPKMINKVGEDAKTMVPIRFLTENLGMKVEFDNDTRNISVITDDYEISDLVVLDAGHGGSDSGALGTLDGEQIKEKDLTLSVTKKVYNILKKEGVNVIMTRNTDVKPELSERADFANEHGAGMFVSIHINSVDNPDPYGIETYYCKTNNDEYSGITSEDLATDIQKNLIKKLDGKDRGVKTANFYVIRETTMPAILIELGFISNEDELRNMCDEKYQQKAAEAIADGIIKNLKTLKETAEENGLEIKPVTVDGTETVKKSAKTEETKKTVKTEKSEELEYPLKNE